MIDTAALVETGPMFMVDNLASTSQYPNHTISANEEATDHEARLVGNGRRLADDHWIPTTLNNAANLDVDCDTVRGANAIVLDRGHNLGGVSISLQASNNGTSYITLLTITIPSVSSPGAPSDALGVHTREGAWIKTFDPAFAKYWRLSIPAMGAGLAPKVVGLWLGTAFTPDFLTRPMVDGGTEVPGGRVQSDAGWIGQPIPFQKGRGTLRFKTNGWEQFSQARMHIEQNFGADRPMWLLHDFMEGQRAQLVMRAGEVGFRAESSDSAYPMIELPWREHEPRVYTG